MSYYSASSGRSTTPFDRPFRMFAPLSGLGRVYSFYKQQAESVAETCFEANNKWRDCRKQATEYASKKCEGQTGIARGNCMDYYYRDAIANVVCRHNTDPCVEQGAEYLVRTFPSRFSTIYQASRDLRAMMDGSYREPPPIAPSTPTTTAIIATEASAETPSVVVAAPAPDATPDAMTTEFIETAAPEYIGMPSAESSTPVLQQEPIADERKIDSKIFIIGGVAVLATAAVVMVAAGKKK